MALYDDFPYTNFHSLNLDWIVRKLSELENGESSEDSSSTATLARNLTGNYPYTNFHALNLDWIIRSMFELESGFETVENEWQGLRAAGLLNDEVKNAILQCFQNVAWVNDHGQQYYNALRDLFFPPVIVDTLTAVLDQGERVFHTGEDVNVIKNYLTVTAKLTDGTLITVPTTQYILTGSLSQDGPNIIVVSYMNASTTITVNAVAVSLVSISAVYTQSGTVYITDTLNSLKSDLVVTATYDDSSTATVPDTDYTLSGTLEVGTSTITVTYEGLTTTFNVTVSAGWAYTPSMGLLKNQPFIDNFTQGTLNWTEEVIDDYLHITSPANTGESTNQALRFIPQTFAGTKASIKVQIRVNDISYTATDNNSLLGNMRFRLSNGTGGAQVGFCRNQDATGDIIIRYMVGSTATPLTSYPLSAGWHTIEAIVENEKQTIKLDDVEVVSNANLSTSYTTANVLYLFGTTRYGNPLNVDIKLIEYVEE